MKINKNNNTLGLSLGLPSWWKDRFRLVSTGLLPVLKFPRLWRTEDWTAVFGLLRSWEFAVLIGLGLVQSRSWSGPVPVLVWFSPGLGLVQSRSFSGYETRLPNTNSYGTQASEVLHWLAWLQASSSSRPTASGALRSTESTISINGNNRIE